MTPPEIVLYVMFMIGTYLYFDALFSASVSGKSSWSKILDSISNVYRGYKLRKQEGSVMTYADPCDSDRQTTSETQRK
jgi:hypothetical protein